jgi:hypothetical protein
MTTRTVPFAERHRPTEAAVVSDVAPDAASQLVGPDGRPARLPKDARCPRCGADADQRVMSGGFGEPHEVCQQCGCEDME